MEVPKKGKIQSNQLQIRREGTDRQTKKDQGSARTSLGVLCLFHQNRDLPTSGNQHHLDPLQKIDLEEIPKVLVKIRQPNAKREILRTEDRVGRRRPQKHQVIKSQRVSVVQVLSLCWMLVHPKEGGMKRRTVTPMKVVRSSSG